jgi:hypothetical protein
MNLLDKVLLEWSYRTTKGYPDLSNEEDLKIFESLFGFDLLEAVEVPFERLSPKAKEIVDNLIEKLGLTKDQIKANSSTTFTIYTPERGDLFDKIEQSGEFGSATRQRSGNWKKDGVTIILKPTGEKSGEYFRLKPQQLGITLDKKIPLTQLKSEIEQGIKNNTTLSENQKSALLYAVSGQGSKNDISLEDLSTGFFNEVNKNFGEIHGALLFGTQNGYDSVEFPAAGNYRLLDYLLYKGEEVTEVSAKADKTIGNTVKYEDVVSLVQKVGGQLPQSITTFTDIIKSNSVITGAFEAIKVFGSEELKQQVENFIKQYPQYPKLGNTPEDRQSHADRIAIEREFVKELNNNPDLDFTEIFNNYVHVKYVKYYLDPVTLQGVIRVIESGQFKTKHQTKNSPGHDADKLGLGVLKA